MATVGLLGTAFAMEHEFYKGRLTRDDGLTVSVSEAAERAIVHHVIYEELCLGRVKESSRREYLRIMRPSLEEVFVEVTGIEAAAMAGEPEKARPAG